jgi:hypothetical protein
MAVDKLAEMLKNLQKAAGSKTTVSSKDDVEACKLEIGQTEEMLQEAQKVHIEAIAKAYELLRNLLSSDVQSQWDRVCCKMHERDSWAGVNGKVTKRKASAFVDCFPRLS